MASGPITSWQIYGETTETVTDFIFLVSFNLYRGILLCMCLTCYFQDHRYFLAAFLAELSSYPTEVVFV